MDPYTPELNMDTTLRDYVRVLFRHKLVILTAIVTVCTTVVLGLKFKTNLYEARVKMLITAQKQVESPYYRDLIGYQNVQRALTQSEIVKSAPVLGRVVRALALDKRPLDDEKRYASDLKARWIDYSIERFNKKIERLPPQQKEVLFFLQALENLKESIKVEPIRDTDMFTISVKDYDPVAATVIANVVSRSYVIFDLEQQLTELKMKYGQAHPTVLQLEENIVIMKKQLDGQPIPDEEAIGPASVKIIEQASIPLKPSGPPKVLTLILAVVMSVFLGLMLAFIFEYMDQTVKNPKDLERYFDLTLLGTIPKTKLGEKVLIEDSPKPYIKTPYTEGYRNLCDQLRLLVKSKNVKTILMTGPDLKEGSTTTIANLASYFAHHVISRVLVIDANFRDTSMHKIFKVENSPGLADFLCDKAKAADIVQEASPYLYVIPAGETHINPVTFLDSPKFGELLTEAKQDFDIVFIDCADLKRYKDSHVIAPLVDGLVILVSESRTRRHVIESVVKPLREQKINILGAVLNNRKFFIPKWVYDRI